jgi:hypothetical protein
MEELTEVITAAEFHPSSCNLFCYSSSKGTVKLADMRDSALCDKHAKCTSCLSFTLHADSIADVAVLDAQYTKKRKILRINPSLARLYRQSATSSSPEMVGTSYLAIILLCESGISIWTRSLSRRSMFMITFVLNYAIYTRTIAFSINSNAHGLATESKFASP